ncbi:MAG: CxxxxCH/CxxCH domain c-type cytochrome [Desulfuromonadaceae bacterium]
MNTSNIQTRSLRVLIALTLMFVSLAWLSGLAEAATCFTCHAPTGSATDIRPVESTYRNITTGSIRGSHAKHIPTATTDANTCTPCHGPVINSTNHRNRFINVTSTTAPGLSYSKGSRFLQSGAANLTLGTCSTASCHDNGKGVKITTPTWGTAAPACTSCHALVPGDSHTQHVTGTLYKKAVCADCHTGYVQGTTAAANHINNTVETNTGSYPTPKAKGSAFGSCSTSYCHSSGQSANGSSATPVYATVTWGGTAACGSCHATTTLTTGTHLKHLAVDTNCDYCHSQAYTYGYNSTNHVNGQIDVTSVGYTAGGAPGNGYGTCSTAMCHGSIAPSAWGVSTSSDSCTKCHGTPTPAGTITSANRHVVAPSDPAATDTGKVSNVAKTGAHQTHLQFFNGLSGQGTEDSRCTDCHGPLPTSGMHVAQFGPPSDPTSTFSGLATKNGAMAPSYSAGSCSNTYCHNPSATGGTLNSANAGTGINPSWTNAGYIADGILKTQANCGTCHKSPGDAGFFSTTTHAANITQDCAGCHGHNGAPGGLAGQQHIDGIKWGSGNCDSCHGYQAASWATAPVINAEGKGAHVAHITYLTTRRYGTAITLTPASDQYASAAASWVNVCGVCHDNSSALHKNGTVNVAISANQEYVFGPAGTVATYNGLPGRLAANDKTCSNISCHYFTTPVWSTY